MMNHTVLPHSLFSKFSSFTVSIWTTILCVVVSFSNTGMCQDLFSAADSISYDILLEDYVVTGQYEPTHYKKAMYHVDVIDKQVIRQLGVTQLDQALMISPSIRIQHDPVLGSRIQMRGMGARNVAIMIDGIPVIGRLDGAIDLSQIALQQVERIEVVEGPLSNLYGNNAAGGVINIITKKSQINPVSLEASTQFESIGQWNAGAQLGFQTGKWLIRGHGRYLNYDKYDADSLRIVDEIPLEDGTVYTKTRYPWNPKTQISAGASIRHQFNDDHHIIIKYDYNTEDVTDYGTVRRPQFKPYANDAFYKTDRNDWALLYSGKWDDWHIDFRSGLNKYERQTDEKRYYLETMTFDSLLQSNQVTNFTSVFSRGNLSRKFNEKLEVSGGLQYNYEIGKGDRLLDATRSDSTTAAFDEIAAYGEARYHILPKLRVSGSARYTHHSTYGGQWTPALILQYELSEKWNVKLSYAGGYRSPSLKELYIDFVDINHFIVGNPDLKPEVSDDWQLDLMYELNSSTKIRLNGYRTHIRDRIQLVEYDVLKYTYANIDSYDVFGFQSGIDWTYGRLKLNSTIGLSYWKNALDHEDVPGYRPTWDMNHQLTYDISEWGMTVLANYRYIGQQPSYILNEDVIETRTTGSINFLDISLQKSFFKNAVSLTAGVRNILDIESVNVLGSSSDQVAHTSSGSRVVSQGRNFFVQASFRLR